MNMNNYNFSDLIKKKFCSVSIKNTKYSETTKRDISNKMIHEEPLDSLIYDKNIYIEVDEFLYY